MGSLRVLFFCSWYPNEENPGLGIFVKRHAEVLAAYGIEVMAVSFETTSGNELEVKEHAESLPGLREVILRLPLNHKKSSAKGLWFIKNYKSLKHIFSQINSEFKPQLLQINVAFPAGVFWWLFRSVLPKKVILAEHWSGYLPEDGRYKGIFQELITQSLVYHSSALLVVSSTLQKAMTQRGLKGNFFPLPNVVDVSTFPYRPRSSNNEFVFIHVSSLDEKEKNPELLLVAFSGLKKIIPDIRLIMVGGGRERIDTLKKMAVDLDIDNKISWEGIRSPKEVANFLYEAHAFVLSSNFEGQPVVLLEAMSSGIPVVSPEVGGIPQMVSHSEGILFPVGNKAELIKAMTEIIRDYQRFDGETISAKVQRTHGKEEVAQFFESVYTKVLANA